jgi:hypothetical protein
MNFRNQRTREFFAAENDAVKAEIKEFLESKSNGASGEISGDVDENGDNELNEHIGQESDDVGAEERTRHEKLSNYQR